MHTIALVGAYGNFGRIIFNKLKALGPDVHILCVGRSGSKLRELTHGETASCWAGDVHVHSDEFAKILRQLNVSLVIHTAGPFQGQDYSVARSAISAGSDYCDLSDCRHFVKGISVLDEEAKAAGVAILSGCSSVPTLSAAVIDQFSQRFSLVDEIDYGISSSALMPGVSTIRGVLAYAGKQITQFIDGREQSLLGWQDLRFHQIDGLGQRLLANVDVPDMDIFPARYGAKTVRFRAGAGLKLGTFANYLAACLARFKLVKSASQCADFLHTMGKRFARFGDGRSAMYITLGGKDLHSQPYQHTWEIVALADYGPHIPSSGSVALTKQIISGKRPAPGARACLGEITMQEYISAIGEVPVFTRDRQGR
ncbi:hypothetical protein HNP46_006514 [Pseudomonas nitritireducens]|uniref:Saccharopine dehydrogenase NADP binding domain-containing protein n=1 Tax=Pseudomonas nitroreducens TaxID=46680 RepID=A0A7W7KS82_PSENT|nr:saccharopine dehydrogenase NADP-binding domain-containing protein [Pseudomonas nitritireducens]MBB4867600.1 hypothetical protein [Pseudomonas nitritireducens]